MANNFDLNINNYTDEDILNLFKVDKNVTHNDLVIIRRKILLEYHPDKSNLDPKLFDFFKLAFNRLKDIYTDIQNHNKLKNPENIKYSNIDTNLNKRIFTKEEMNSGNFNEWFNDVFNNNYIPPDDESKGYEKWIKNHKSSNVKIQNSRDMDNYFKKQGENVYNQNQQQIQLYGLQKINMLNISSGRSLDKSKLKNYSSGIFERLGYTDLKDAYSNKILPYSDNDNSTLTSEKLSKLKNERANLFPKYIVQN